MNTPILRRLKDYSGWVLGLGIALCIGLAAGLINLTFDYSYRAYFTEDNQQLNDFDEIQNRFTQTDNVIFVIRPQVGDVFTQEVLSAIHWLTEESWQLPYSIRVDSISNYQHSYAQEDDLIIEALVEDPSTLNFQSIEKLKTVALSEHSLVNRLVAIDGGATAINIQFSLPLKSPWETPEIAKATAELKARFEERFQSIEIHAAGYVLLNNAFVATSMDDMLWLMPLMTTVMSLLLFMFLRSWTGVAATLLITTLSIGATVGLFSWLQLPLTGTSVSAPMIILTIAIANSVHILVNFQQNLQAGQQKVDAIFTSLKQNCSPVLITSLTTAIGFASLNFSDSPPFRDLGNLSAIGILFAAILSLIVLPAFVLLLPYKVPEKQSLGLDKRMNTFAEQVIGHQGKVFVGMILTVAVLASFISNNEINDQFEDFFKARVEFRQATDFINEHLSGTNTLEVAVRHRNGEQITHPEYLVQLDELNTWLNDINEVRHVDSVTHLFKRLNKNLHHDNEAFYALPKTQEEAAQYLLLYEMSLPAGLDVNNQISQDKQAARFYMTLRPANAKESLAIEQRIKQHISAAYPELDVTVSSVSLMFSHVGQTNGISMVQGSLTALVFISIILVVALKSWKLGLLSLIPNLVPVVMAFGIWGISFQEIGIAVSCAIGMTLGIVVDDTVHFLTKYKKFAQTKSTDEAVRATFGSVGHALLITSVVLSCGFCVLAASGFQMNADVGIFNALTIALALICDFLLLPTLLLGADSIKSFFKLDEQKELEQVA